MILISACLLGVPCRYDGAAQPLRSFPPEFAGQALLPVCPEELGGLSTPRPAAEISEGDGAAVLAGDAQVLRADGTEVTEGFLRGAARTVKIAQQWGVRRACFKSKSPSCGAGRTHVGGEVADGWGVTAAALRQAGLEVVELD